MKYGDRLILSGLTLPVVVAHRLIADSVTLCALQEYTEAFQVATVEGVVSEVDIFTSSARNFTVVTLDHEETMLSPSRRHELALSLCEDIGAVTQHVRKATTFKDGPFTQMEELLSLRAKPQLVGAPSSWKSLFHFWSGNHNRTTSRVCRGQTPFQQHC